jgi:membrane-associated phospholipid phosphatase/phosphoglycolate phosphatase-like HAD superfamily hydrolase
VLLALVGLLLAFVVLAGLVDAHAGGGLDGRTIAWMQQHQHASLDHVALALDGVGRWWALGVLAALAAWLLAGAGRRRDAVYLVATVVMAMVLNLLLKLVFRRTPPGGVTGVSHPSRYAFPSGHTMITTALVAGLILIAWPTRWRWAALTAGSLLAAGMGLSRVYISMHWPSDVAAGWALGVAVALGIHLLLPTDDEAREANRNRHETPIEVVFFDWGNTLMVDDPSQEGPMAMWPHVKTVAGAQDALRSLHPHYRLVVATNADLSDAALVRAALARVGLDEFIDDVVSSCDVCASKPDAFFYRAALLRVGRAGLPLDPARAVMVGDSWPNDVVGAKGAHLRAVWLNPQRAELHGRLPAPDAEIRSLAELPAVLDMLGGPSGKVSRVNKATVSPTTPRASANVPSRTTELP